jgi:hypothetical protein
MFRGKCEEAHNPSLTWLAVVRELDQMGQSALTLVSLLLSNNSYWFCGG